MKDPSKLVHSQGSADLTFSYFYEGLEYWNENNSSNDYELFYSKMVSTIGPNLAIVLHYQDFIVKALFESIRQESPFALVPFVNLICLIAKDLRSSFYSAYGRETFLLLSHLLKANREPSVVEAVFMCITYLFKYLTPEISNDFDALSEIFTSLIYLPNERQFYNRKFMSEALGFLIKRANFEKLPSIFKALISLKTNLTEFDENFQIFSSMLFFSIKSVKGSLHSKHLGILSCFCHQIENFNGKMEIILCLMEMLLRHFENCSEKLHELLKTHFFPLIFCISLDMSKQQIDYLFGMLRKILQISKNSLLPDCMNFMSNVYFPIAKNLSVELQAIGMEFLFFILQSVTLKEILELKIFKLIEQLLIERPVKYCLWVIFRLSQLEPVGNAYKSILNSLNIEAVDSVYQLAMLKFLGFEEKKVIDLQANFESSFDICQKIFFKDLSNIEINIKDFCCPLVLKYACDNFDSLVKSNMLDLSALTAVLVSNLSCAEGENLRLYSLKLLKRVLGEDDMPILIELENCQLIPLSFHTYKNKVVYLRNIEILLNSLPYEAISPICREIVAGYLIGDIYFALSCYSKEVFTIIRDLVGKLGQELFTVWKGEFFSLLNRNEHEEHEEQSVENNLEHFDTWLSQWYKRTIVLSASLSPSRSYKISQLLEVLTFAPKIGSNYEAISNFFVERHLEIPFNHLLSILKFFAQLSGVHSADLYQCFLSLLIHSNEQIQQYALKACFSFQKSICHFNEQEREILLNLVDGKAFKEELLSLTLAESQSLRMPVEIRANIIEFIIRILYGKMGKKFHNSGLADSRKKAIFAFFATLEGRELSLLFKLIFRPFLVEGEFIWRVSEEPIVNQSNHSVQRNYSEEMEWADESIPDATVPSEKQCLGVLANVKEIISQLSNYLRSSGSFANTILDFLCYCLFEFHHHSQIRSHSLKCLSELFELDLSSFEAEKVEKYFGKYFGTKTQSPEGFCRDYCQIETSAVLSLFVSLSRFPRYHTVFDRNLLNVFVHAIGFEFIPLRVKEIIFQMLNRISHLCVGEFRQLLFKHITVFIKSFSAVQMKKHQEIFEQLFILIQQLTKESGEFLQESIKQTTEEYKCNFEEISTLICTLLKQHSLNMESSQKISLLRIVNSLVVKDSSLRQVIFENLSEQLFVEDEPEIRFLLISLFDHFLTEDSKRLISGTNAIFRSSHSNPSVFFELNNNLTAFESLQLDESLLLIYNLMHFVKCNDFAWRSNAVESIKQIMNCCKNSKFHENWISVILDCIKQLLKLHTDSVSLECYSIFHQAIFASSRSSFQVFKEDVLLFSLESESNYFSNILHLQVHRRIKALSRLKSFASGQLSLQLDIFCDFFLPQIHQFCYSGNCDLNLANEAVSTIAAVFSRTQESFHRINGYLKKIKKDKYKKASMKIICQMCESVQVTPDSLEFIDYLDKFVFPVLQENLFKKSCSSGKDEKVSLNSSLIIAMTSLLKRCRECELNRHSPRIIFVIGNVLKSKTEASRKIARECLVRVFQILGTTYANFLFKELIATLNRGGYHTQVLVSTVHFLLNAIESLTSTGACTLLQVLFPLALPKQTFEEFQGTQVESATKNIPLVFERVAQIASDVECFEIIRSCFQENFSLISNSKDRLAISKLVEHFAIGLGKNRNLTWKSLLSISFVLLDETQWNEWFVALSLGNLKQVLKNNEHFEDENLLFPFLQVLPRIMGKLSDPSMIRMTLTCLCLLHERIVTKSVWIDALANEDTLLFLLDLASSVNPNSAEIRKSFGLAIKIICLLASKDSVKVNTNFQARMKGLALMISTSGASRYEEELLSVLNLFSTIISLEIVFSEFFDIMEEQVFPLVLNSHRGEVRELARQVFSSYLTRYPITTKRFQHVLCERIVKNLDYDFEDGKYSCLELLYTLLCSLPIENYGESVEFLFMNFVLHIGNLDSPQLVNLLGKCIYKLVEEGILVQRFRNSLLRLANNFLSHVDDGDRKKHLAIQSSILRAISFTPRSFLNSFDCPQVNDAIMETFQVFPTDTLLVIYRLLQNEFKIDSSFWDSLILLDFTALESLPCPLSAISCQLKLMQEFFSIIPSGLKDKVFHICIKYAANSVLIGQHDTILSFLIEMFRQRYSTDNFVCTELCKQLFAKFRVPTSNAQFLVAFYLLCMRFFGAAVSALDWDAGKGDLNSQVLLETIRFLQFVEHNKKRLRLDDEQLSLLNEVLSIARKVSPSGIFSNLYQQAQLDAEEQRVERRAKRAKERLEERV